MNKSILFLLVSVLALSISSCSEKKKSYTQLEMEYRDGLTKEDTTQMLKLADGCMELLKNKKINDAIAMLNEYNDSTQEILPLSEKTKVSLEKRYKMFPVISYEREYYSFLLEGANDVRYIVKFAEEDDPETNGNPITKFMFNPVKKDGIWYLCVKSEQNDFDQYRN